LVKQRNNLNENIQKNLDDQRSKLRELLRLEEEARDTLKSELDQYRRNLMKSREKNLKMKYNLSFLNHLHHLTKPYVFSYNVDWPLEDFGKPLPPQKNKKPAAKKK
jgi:hypothetical protein